MQPFCSLHMRQYSNFQAALNGVRHELHLLEMEENLLMCQLSGNSRCHDKFHNLEDHLRRIVMDKQKLSAQEQSLEQQISELEY